MIRQINRLRKKMIIAANTPTVLLYQKLNKFIDKQEMPFHVRTLLKGQVHGSLRDIEIAEKLWDKHEDKVFCRTTCIHDYWKAYQQCILDGTIDKFLEDADYVEEIVLAQ
jgi:hypothetical protein